MINSVETNVSTRSEAWVYWGESWDRFKSALAVSIYGAEPVQSLDKWRWNLKSRSWLKGQNLVSGTLGQKIDKSSDLWKQYWVNNWSDSWTTSKLNFFIFIFNIFVLKMKLALRTSIQDIIWRYYSQRRLWNYDHNARWWFWRCFGIYMDTFMMSDMERCMGNSMNPNDFFIDALNNQSDFASRCK
jgi:hypothetical protein